MTELEDAFLRLDNLKTEDGWYQIEVKRHWSYGDVETAHWLWNCTVGRFTESGGLNSNIKQKCVAYGSAYNDSAVVAINQAVDLAHKNALSDADQLIAQAKRAVAEEDRRFNEKYNSQKDSLDF